MMATCFNKARAVGVATMAVGVLFYWVHCFCTVNILLYEFKFNASYGRRGRHPERVEAQALVPSTRAHLLAAGS